jgi:hypothetical protein
MMTEDRFWQLIAESRRRVDRNTVKDGDEFHDRQTEAMRELLRKLTPDEIAAYQWRFDDYRNQAYRWDVWGAAYWLGGGCSDDGFLDFRSCLVSLGKELFSQVLNDPDSVADIVDRIDVPYLQSEGFQYLGIEVYREQTGSALPEPEDNKSWPHEPEGKRFDFEDEDEMAERYPKLVAKFPDMGD